jgi:hypothetical protein
MLIGRDVKPGWRLDTIPRRHSHSWSANLNAQEVSNAPGGPAAGNRTAGGALINQAVFRR